MLTINSTYTNPTSELSFWEISDPITQCSSEATKESEEFSCHTSSVSNVKSICRLVQWLYHRGRGTNENEVACLHTCPTTERFAVVGQFSSVGGKAFLPIPVSAGGEVVTPLGGEVAPICRKAAVHLGTCRWGDDANLQRHCSSEWTADTQTSIWLATLDWWSRFPPSKSSVPEKKRKKIHAYFLNIIVLTRILY